MASEAVVVSTQTTTVEEVKEKLNEEVKSTIQESESPPKESGDQNPKAEELPSVEPSVVKIEETTVDKPTEEPPASVTILSEAEEKAEDKPIVVPVVEEVVKTEDIPVVDIPVKEDLKVAHDPVPEPDTSSVPEVVVDGVKSQPEEQPAIESTDVKIEEQPAIEPTDVKIEEQPASESVNKETEEQPETDSIAKHPDEQPNIVDVPISSVEAIEKPEELLKVTPIEEPEVVTVIEREQPTVPEVEKKSEPAIVPEVEEKIEPAVAKVEEQPELTVPEVEEKLDSAVLKVEEIPEPTVAEVEEKSEAAAPKVEEKEEPAIAEVEEKPEPTVVVVEEKPDSAVPNVEEKPKPAVPEVEDKPGEQPIADNGNVPGETKKEEVPLPVKVEDITILKEDNISKDQEVLASESSDQVVSTNREAQADSKEDEVPSTPSVVEKIGGDNIEKEASGVSGVEGLLKEAVLVELPKAEPIKVEDVENAVSTAEVTTTSVEGESKSRDVELLPEIKNEDIKDEKPASVEVNKEDTAAVIKQVVDPQESELEVKSEETVKAEADKLEKEEVEETVKSDVPNLEPSSKLGDDTKTSEDLPKEVPAKPTQKQSNNILTKVKKTIVKAKKAILGKSPTSKTIIADTKDDIEVKS